MKRKISKEAVVKFLNVLIVVGYNLWMAFIDGGNSSDE